MTIDRTRRRVLKGSMLVAASGLAGLAGCSGLPGGGGGGSTDPLSVVPSAADNVAFVDVAGILDDSGIEQIANTVLSLAAEQPDYTGPTSKKDALKQFRNTANLDPTKLETVVGFSKYGEQNPTDTQYAGAWYRAAWAEEDVVSSIESQGASLAKESYEGHTVYAPESEMVGSSWIAVISAEEYAIGTEQAVKDVVDVVEGNDDGVSETLRTTYENARSGLVKVAATVPETLPTRGAGTGAPVDVTQLNKVTASTAVLYHDGNELGVKATLETKSGDDAEDVRNVIAGGISTAEGFVEQQSSTLVDVLDAIEVSRDGTTVTVEYSNTVEELNSLIETIVQDLQSAGAGGSMATVSNVLVAPHRGAVGAAFAPVGLA